MVSPEGIQFRQFPSAESIHSLLPGIFGFSVFPPQINIQLAPVEELTLRNAGDVPQPRQRLRKKAQILLLLTLAEQSIPRIPLFQIGLADTHAPVHGTSLDLRQRHPRRRQCGFFMKHMDPSSGFPQNNGWGHFARNLRRRTSSAMSAVNSPWHFARLPLLIHRL